MSKRSYKRKERLPRAVGPIQVNFCKNPECQNFGVPASTKKQPKGPGAKNRDRDTYTVIGTSTRTSIWCSYCGQRPRIKSNQGIYEEFNRLWKLIEPPSVQTCPNQDCPNQHIGINAGRTHYQSFGRTKAGSKRCRCKACGKTFVIDSSPTIRQRKPHKNAAIFRLLVNKVPFRRICEIEGITMSTLYRKIRFLQQQCNKFIGRRERKLHSMQIARLYIGEDRQDYVINWTDSEDRRNVTFRAIGSADNATWLCLWPPS